jgi:outer membrane protein assembly factor BamB
MPNFTIAVRSLATLAVAAAAPMLSAQMGGGMGRGVGSTASGGIGMYSSMADGMGMGMMASGPAVGADGTAYVLRDATASATPMGSGVSTATRQLVAINPATGAQNWSVSLTGTMLSVPVLGKAGAIYLTASEPPFMANAGANGRTSSLIVISSTGSSAAVQSQIAVPGDILSTPQVTPDGQTIYVISTDMPQMLQAYNGSSQFAGSVLYAYSASGQLKFKVQLSQGQGTSSMPHM